MPRFKRKPTCVEAEQFTDADNPPPGVETAGDDPNWFQVTTMQSQVVRVQPGEWIVKESSGDGYYPIAADEFRRIYEPA